MKLSTFVMMLSAILSGCGTLDANNNSNDDRALGSLYIQSKLGLAGVEECAASFPKNQEEYEKTYANWFDKNQSKIEMGYKYLVKQASLEGQNVDEVLERESQNTKSEISSLQESEKLKRCEHVLQVLKN